MQKRCSSFSDGGECNGGFLHSLLKTNWQISATFCDDNLQELVKQHLEPVLQNIDHETSYEYVLFVIGDVESQYWDCALGPAAEEVYKKYLMVRIYNMFCIVRLKHNTVYLMLPRLQ